MLLRWIAKFRVAKTLSMPTGMAMAMTLAMIAAVALLATPPLRAYPPPTARPKYGPSYRQKALTPNQLTRTAFVQLFEWPWKDVAHECEAYLGPAGFSAVQVSPPNEHNIWPNNPWWERYQVVSYKLDSRSGNEAEFADMVQRCRKAGVEVYVDAILNHMTGMISGTGFAGTLFTHYEYPGLYANADFHHCGRNGNDNIVNFSDRYELQNCELVDLADLATESEKVRNTLATYLNHLLDLGVTGFRIDAAKHIAATDIGAILAKIKRPAYIYQEIIYDRSGPIQYKEYLPMGDVMDYEYPFTLARSFQGKNLNSLLRMTDGLPAGNSPIVFLTNHDLERHGDTLSFNTNQRGFYRLAQIFMLAWPYGYPQLFSGFQFKDKEAGPPVDTTFKTLPILNSRNKCKAPWTCEHRLPEIAAMIEFRKKTAQAPQVDQWWSNDQDVMAFSRGAVGFVAINSSAIAVTRSFSTTLSTGDYCNILDPGCSQKIHVQNGSANVTLPPMSAVVLLKR